MSVLAAGCEEALAELLEAADGELKQHAQELLEALLHAKTSEARGTGRRPRSTPASSFLEVPQNGHAC